MTLLYLTSHIIMHKIKKFLPVVTEIWVWMDTHRHTRAQRCIIPIVWVIVLIAPSFQREIALLHLRAASLLVLEAPPLFSRHAGNSNQGRRLQNHFIQRSRCGASTPLFITLSVTRKCTYLWNSNLELKIWT